MILAPSLPPSLSSDVLVSGYLNMKLDVKSDLKSDLADPSLPLYHLRSHMDGPMGKFGFLTFVYTIPNNLTIFQV